MLNDAIRLLADGRRKRMNSRLSIATVCALAWLACLPAICPADPGCPQRQDLRRIVNSVNRCDGEDACLREAAIYTVASIRDTSYLARAHRCKDETARLESRSEVVAMRDRKMCSDSGGGLEDKVHALVMPRGDVTGVERISEVPAIWSFAWNLGMTIVPDDKDIFLVVNSKYSRGQDWLHVHVVEGNAAELEARRSSRPASFGATLVQIDTLDQVPKTIDALTGNAASTGEFSILVAGKKSAGDGKERFSVLVEKVPACYPDNTEKFYLR